MIRPFINTSFVGEVNNMSPPDGIPVAQWVRWDFGSAFSSYSLGQNTIRALDGTFVNLHNSTTFSPCKLCDVLVCEPSLCANASACAWYEGFWGASPAMQLYWNPAMHLPGDSEFVPVFSSAITYMSGAPRPNELLVSNVDLTKEYTFVIHGTPIGTPQNFTGRFAPLLPPPRSC